jgi:hypothetical protein
MYVYCDKLTDNYIEMIIKDDCSYIQKHYIDPDNGKLFVSLLKEAFDDIKKKGITIYRQYVLKDEYSTIIKNVIGWTIIDDDEDDDVVILECSVDDAPLCIVQGLLFDDN